MTRGDFILGVLSSLVATILFELARKFYPRLRSLPVIELGKWICKLLTIQRLSKRILASSMGLVIAFLTLVKLPLPTAFAPNMESREFALTLVRKDDSSIELIVKDSPEVRAFMNELKARRNIRISSGYSRWRTK